MSHFDYEASKRISAEDPPFFALVMAAMRQADTMNTEKLKAAFPDVYDELRARYNSPGGILPSDAQQPSYDELGGTGSWCTTGTHASTCTCSVAPGSVTT